MIRLLASTLLLGSCVVVGCASDTADVVAITGAWSRPSPPGAVDGVIYFSLTTDVPDAVVSVITDPPVARAVELHESMLDGSTSGHHHGNSGEPTDHMPGFDVAPGHPLVLEPGGRHVMLVGLKHPLVAGESFGIVVTMSSGRTVRAPVTVADNPPAG